MISIKKPLLFIAIAICFSGTVFAQAGSRPTSVNSEFNSEFNSVLSTRLMSQDADQDFYFKLQYLSSQISITSAKNYARLKYLLDQVSDLRNDMKAAYKWTTSVEIDLTNLENTILEKSQGVKKKDPKIKLLYYIYDVTDEDTYVPTKDPIEMNVTELVNAFVDKIAYEIASYGNIARASKVLTDKKAVAIIIGTLDGKSSSVILDKVKSALKEKYQGSSSYIDNGLVALEMSLPNLRLVEPVKTSAVKEPQSISEALKLSSDLEELIEEYPAVFTYQNMLEFVTSAGTLPKAQALNVLTQATNITNLLGLSATETQGITDTISNMANTIAAKDKDLLAERILAFYDKHLLMVGDISSKNAIIEGFKDYLLIHDVFLNGDADLCKIVSGTAEREEGDSIMAFRGKAQKDGALFLLLLANNPTIVFNGATVQMPAFLANNISNKEAISSYLVEQAKATPEGDLVVNRNGVDQIIKVTGATKEKAYLLLQEAEPTPTLMLEE
jgi:hypothetical protein